MARNGQLKLVATTDPAANTEFSQAVTAAKWWRLLSVSVSLAQGATQTPQPTLIIDDGTAGGIVFQGFGASSAQNASVTARYTWAPNLPLSAAGALTIVTAPLPEALVIGPGYRVRSVTTGIGANTDYGAANLYVVEYDREPEWIIG